MKTADDRQIYISVLHLLCMVKNKEKKTPMTKMSPNGQVVIPGKIREETGLKPGMQFLVFNQDGNVVMKPLREEVWSNAAGNAKKDTVGVEAIDKSFAE